METKDLKVPNISCGHCVMTIKNELSEIRGIKSVQGDENTKQVTVDYEAPADLDQIRDKLKEINYPAE
ncbi:MAG: heavy-metal-associated domain-containing protein [Desulfobacterales bacterium]|nr:heavy-metal-associated domain-containing protein [Desulfobacterales bacterium]MBS3755458.1 heavy-metal-associated domain-containing protein [Desulfobacterales bacterium]